MKVSGAVLIILSCTMIGAELYNRQRIAKRILHEVYQLAVHILNYVRFDRSDPESILRSFCSEDHKLTQKCISQIDYGFELSEAWSIAADNPALTAAEKETVLELLCQFGQLDLDGEISRLKRLEYELETLYNHRSEECVRNRKLYLSSGILSGVLIVLLMI